MKLVSKKLTLGLGCAVAALTFTACGTSAPDCDDSDVQEEIKAQWTEHFSKGVGIIGAVNHSNRQVSEFGKQAEKILKEEIELELSHFSTERVDDKRNRVVCQAKISGDIDDKEKFREAIELLEKAGAAKRLPDDEVLTDTKFDEYIKRAYSTTSNYERKLDKLIEEIDESLNAMEHFIDYTAKATDDGKLIVEVEKIR
ncbi:hypothetical protein Hc94105_1142 [Helicobacter cinaedi]|uniref:hypothetical protein n=1 Tax=Helicobacter cinaedi TaxID=213 RepID=UPI001F1637BD|nr:hypothetical protein [Helicobacter cinaedi]BDB66940.1 hypothetical protein Hc94105_1142 [Helicobacter cinaedi]